MTTPAAYRLLLFQAPIPLSSEEDFEERKRSQKTFSKCIALEIQNPMVPE